MSRLLRGVVATLAATVLLAGCQPSAPGSPTPSSPPPSATATPTPTFLCTPEAGGEATECTQAQYDEMKAKDALYAEAEEVYRRFFAESVRLSRAGGTAEPTEVLLETSTGDYLANMIDIFTGMRERGVRAKGTDPKLVISRLPGKAKSGSVVALKICIDSRGWAFYRGESRVTSGRLAVDDVYFSRLGESLKMIGADGRETTTCA